MKDRVEIKPYDQNWPHIFAKEAALIQQALFGSRFLTLIEKWLRSLGIQSIHAESRQSSLRFYLKTAIAACRLMTLKAMDPIQTMLRR